MVIYIILHSSPAAPAPPIPAGSGGAPPRPPGGARGPEGDGPQRQGIIWVLFPVISALLAFTWVLFPYYFYFFYSI